MQKFLASPPANKVSGETPEIARGDACAPINLRKDADDEVAWILRNRKVIVNLFP